MDQGEQEVKNISEPVRVWLLRNAEDTMHPGRAGTNKSETKNVSNDSAPREKPSIAVLPFTNINDDPAQEYFIDGITEDLTTDLARMQWLFVIASSSTKSYKGAVIDVKRVGRELGARYLLDGSVRRNRDRLRVNARLLDAQQWNSTLGGTLRPRCCRHL